VTQTEVDKFIARVFQYLDTLGTEPFIARKTFETNNTLLVLLSPIICSLPGKAEKRCAGIGYIIDNIQILRRIGDFYNAVK
jgi:hypothetical protein